jgi:2-polyprenyl-6-hydroxyphenyl methylase / 3-demethylubiquinone-9 3-methyltransferase
VSLRRDPDHNEIKFLHKFVDLNEKRVLEIGCGEGRLTWQYANETRFTLGLDLDRDALRVARVDSSLELADIVHLACADSIHLPFAKEKFDIAILAWSL